MNARRYALASRNPVVQVLSLLAFGAVLVGAVLMGAVILVFLLGLAVLGAVVFSVRLWWLRRRLQRQAEQGGGHPQSRGRYIETEYRVVNVRRPHERSRD